MFLTANKSSGEGFLVDEVFLLFSVRAIHNGIKTKEELLFVQYMECKEKGQNR